MEGKRFALFLIVPLALASRLLPGIVCEAECLFPDDPPYHVLRVTKVLSAPPAPTAKDPMVAHPFGAVVHWPWGFDWLLSALAFPFVGLSPNPSNVAFVTSFFPPIFGALSVWLLFSVALKTSTWLHAVAAATLLAIMPAHVEYSIFGRVDHHVIEPFIALVGLIGPLRRTRRSILLSALGVGLSFAFVPAALPLALLTFAVGAWLLLYLEPRLALSHSLGFFTGTLISLLASPHPCEWVFYSPSLLQLTIVGIFACGAALAGAFAPTRARFRWLLWLLSSVVLGLFCLLVFPGFRLALLSGVHYLGGGGFAALSLEAQGFVSNPKRFVILTTWLSPLTLFGVSTWLWKKDPERAALAALATGLLFLAFSQRRFLVAASPFCALAMAEGFGALFVSNLRRQWRIAIGILGFALLLPSLHRITQIEPTTPETRAVAKAARALQQRPGLGVLAPWSVGHLVKLESGLPTVCDNFFGPPENDAALERCLRLLYETEPKTILDTLYALKIGYVILRAPHPQQVRTETALLGLDSATFVTEDGSFTSKFRDTFWLRLGLFGMTAKPGDPGPFGAMFLGRFAEYSEKKEVIAEILAFAIQNTGQ